MVPRSESDAAAHMVNSLPDLNYFTYAPALEGAWDGDPLAPEGIAERRAHLHWLVDTLLADMRGRGVSVAEPSDPLHDDEFIRALIATYTIAPTTDWIERDPAVRRSS